MDNIKTSFCPQYSYQIRSQLHKIMQMRLKYLQYISCAGLDLIVILNLWEHTVVPIKKDELLQVQYDDSQTSPRQQYCRE